MSVPVITQNTPPGGITWTAFHMVYQGADTLVNAGSTTNKFTWWRYNGGAPVVEGGPDIPPTFDWVNDCLLFLNKNGVGLCAINTSVVEGSLIVNDSILANAIAANQVDTKQLNTNAVTAVKIATDAVTAGKILAGSVTANKIAAGAITADKLGIGSYTSNLAINPCFEEMDPDTVNNPNWVTAWTRVTGTGYTGAVYALETTSPISGGQSLKMTATTGNQALVYGKFVPIAQGEDFYMSALVYSTVASSQSVALGLWFYDKNFTFLSANSDLDINDVGTTEAYVQYTGTIPATGAYVVPVLLTSSTAPTYWDNIEMGHRITTVKIADGAVTAKQIHGDTITGDVIHGGEISGDHIASTVMASSQLAIGALDANYNVTGPRVQIDPSGLQVIDANNNPRASFPTDPGTNPSVLGDFTMTSGTVLNNFKMNGTNNEIATTGRLQLAAGVTAPTYQPTVTTFYDTIQLDVTTKFAAQVQNPGYNLGTFALDPSQITSMDWSPAESCFVMIQQRSNGYRYWRFKADGTVQINIGTGKPWIDDYNDRYNGFVCTDKAQGRGAMFFSFQSTSANWYMQGWKPGSSTQEFNTIPQAWILDVASRPPGIAYDAVTNPNGYILFQSNGGAGGTLHFRRFHQQTNPSGSYAQVAQDAANAGPATSGLSQRLQGLVYGNQIQGSGTNYRYTFSADNTLPIYVWDTGSPMVQKNTNGAYEMWAKPVTSQAFCHDGTNFCSLDGSGKITKYTSWVWPETGVTSYIGLSAYDNVGTTHETAVGNLWQANQARRAKLNIQVPPTGALGGANVDEVKLWRIYYQRTATNPLTTGTGMKWVADKGQPGVNDTFTMLADATGAAPPGGLAGTAGAGGGSPFPGTSPASLVSSESPTTPLINLKGDGSGRVGPLSWNTSGTDLSQRNTYMSFTSSAATAMVVSTFTLVAGWAADSVPGAATGSFISGVPSGLFTFSLAGVYQVIATGTVSGGGTANPFRRIIGIFPVNSTANEIIRCDSGAGQGSNSPWTGQVIFVKRFAVNDTFTVQLWQNAGAGLAPMGATPGHEVQIIRLSD